MPADSMMCVIQEKIRDILVIRDIIIPDNEDLSAYGLDSMKTVRLVVVLEESFDILFEDKELLFENFATIHIVADLVRGKLVNKDDQSQRTESKL